MYYKKVEGERVYLSPMCVDDAPKYVKWMNDSRVTDGLNGGKNIVTLESEKAWIENSSKSGDYELAIVKKGNDEYLKLPIDNGTCLPFKELPIYLTQGKASPL